MLAFLLFRQIIILFLIMFTGVFLVRSGILKKEEQRVLAQVLLNVAMPCVIINAFLKVDYTPAIRNGFILMLAASALMQVLLITVTKLMRKPFHLTPIEEGSIEYCNAGTLMVPLVTAVLGGEWVVYAATFLCIQNFFLWTHAVSLVSGIRQTDVKKLLKNTNLIAVVIGALLFLVQCPVPAVLRETMDSISAIVGPLTMISTGMILAEADLRKIFMNPRIYFIIFLKMIATPLLCLLVLKYSPLSSITENANEIMMVLTMILSAPSANLITQWSAIYNKDVDYAGSIGTATMLVCIVTMPLMIFLFEI